MKPTHESATKILTKSPAEYAFLTGIDVMEAGLIPSEHKIWRESR